VELAAVRQALRLQHKLRIGYRDVDSRQTERTVWPIALGSFDRVQVRVAWCELRVAIRHFRIDRIDALQALGERYPGRRVELMKAWREREGLVGEE
jgi:predicted DNA-binding transcriptional regulator YafY